VRHAISLTFVLAGFWWLLSGYFVPLLLGLGVVSIVLVVAISLRMDAIDQEGQRLNFNARVATYWIWLAGEIVKANVDVLRGIWGPASAISPTQIALTATQQTSVGRVTYANSITLTPGTVAMWLRGDQIEVHSLTREAAESLLDGEMDRRVRELEE
jgi:multicomponent Na+:H+ antiporter subunit E